ncbi:MULTISPECIES: SDR family NAD(P)-dependent oxidoreductase [Paraburkholderia]|uniref:3-alpha-(Or 20-beta)-hydroxysteroid dehydrogenase n=1 Tax=Paraburkholderia nemoris TaxID=2793076 RepID=A0ABN7KZM3_9BURK|nr:SDR family NAD(P)-dependent oxidoreductase [Paraburkholderia aspalathi]CAE6723018.1 3-alpha-(or 20-beta)-hydroxysteroid dehydrogenase [Paraburkholderia nemoris]CAE6750075.1 3-alpha-(or 20-beta)-hydroxysteroid dehydrogenase [Paraburkholderia nemoris]
MTRAFAAAGSKVLICDIQPEILDWLAKELPEVYGFLANVFREEAVASMFDVADQKLGGLDVLVNNACVAGPTGGIETLPLAGWERTLTVNLTGQFLCVLQAVPRLRKGSDPSIVNLASATGHLGMQGRSLYSASKWAVVGPTKTLAIELGGKGIRVNSVLPGAWMVLASGRSLPPRPKRPGSSWTHGHDPRYRQHGPVRRQ